MKRLCYFNDLTNIVRGWITIVIFIIAIIIADKAKAQAPANDNCPGINLTPSANLTCNSTTGNVANATQSLAGCSGNANDDVWYNFVATSTSHNVVVTGATGFDAVLQVFSGSCGGTSVVCRDVTNAGGTETATLTNLTIGNTYWVRVYHYYAAIPSNTTFSICVTTVPPPPVCAGNLPAGDFCSNATPICDLNGYCGNTSASYGADYWSQLGSAFCGTIENNSFLKFVAGATSISFDVWVTSSTTNKGIQIMIFSANNCTGPVTSYACWSPGSALAGPTTISAAGLTPGNTYYIMIDGYAGDVCNYSIAANTGILLPVTVSPATVTACNGQSVVLTASGGTGSYTWTPSAGLSATSGSTVAATLNTGGTYTYTATSAASNTICPVSNSASAVLTINTCSCPTAASNNGPVCAGNTFNLSAPAGLGASYSWVGPGGFTSSLQSPTGVVAPSTAGSYGYTLTVTSGTVSCSSTTLVVVKAKPSITAPSPVSVCAGSNVAATSFVSVPAGATYAWTNSNTAVGLATNGAGNVPSFNGTNGTTSPITSTVTVTPTLSGCAGTPISYSVTINPQPTSSYTQSAHQCLSVNSFNFTNTGTGAAATHSWSFPSATPSTSSALSPTGVTWAAAGTYTVTHTTTIGSCVSTNTSSVNVYPNPTAPSLNGGNPTCGNNNGLIAVTASTGGTPAYQYNVDGGTNTALTNYTNLAPGTHTVNVTDANGCKNNSTITITNQPGASAVALTSNTSHCGQTDGSISVGTVTGGTGPSYTYNINGGTYGAATTFNSLNGPATYTVGVKDANGCVLTQTISVASASGPTAQVATPTSSKCGNANGSVALGATTGGSAPYTYSFNSSAFSGTTSYTNLLAGTYTYSVKDNFGCTFSSSVAVTNIAGPTAVVLTPGSSTCGNSNGQLTIGAVTGGIATYSFAVNGGASTTTTSYPGLNASTYTVVVTDANGCLYTSNTTISNVAGPTNVALVTTPATCGGNNGTLTIGAVTGGTGAMQYSFDGSAFSGTLNYTGLVANTHTVIVRDANACTYTTTIGVSNSGGPSALNVTSTNSSCTPSNGTVSILGQTGGSLPFTYSFNGSAFSGTTNYTNVAPGTYPVTVNDNNGCQFSDNVTVGITPSPTSQNLTSTNATCGNANGVVAFGSTIGGTSPYTYSFNGSAFSSTTSYSITAGTYTLAVKDANGCQFVTSAVVGNTPGPVAQTLTGNNATCSNANGSIDVGPTSGGTSPYSYSLNGGAFTTSVPFTALSAANYTVVVKDANSCIYTSQIAVANIAGPTAQAFTTTNATCNAANGDVTIGATTGGTIDYQYSFNGSPFSTTVYYPNLSAGSYPIVTRDFHFCTYSVTAVITNTAGPTAVTLTSVSANCGHPNGSVSVGSVTGGTLPYQYSIDGTNFQAGTLFAGLVPASYTVTVKDANNCVVTNTVAVGNIMTPTLSLGTVTHVTCNGGSNGSAIIIATGGAGSNTYVLSTGFTNGTGIFSNLSAGTYTATVTDLAGCNETEVFTINQPALLAGSVQSSTNVPCFGGANGTATITQTGGVAPYTYSLNGGGFGSSTNFTGLSASNYTVVVRDNNGCTVNVPFSITQPSAALALTFSTVNSNCSDDNGSATVVATGGTPIYNYNWSNGAGSSSTTIPVVAGTYSVTVTDSKGCTKNGSAIVTSTPGGVATISSLTHVGCAGGNTGAMTVSMTGGSTAPYTYAWTPNVGGGATISNLIVGTYSVTVTDVHGCSTSTNGIISEPSALSMNLTSTNISCNSGSDGTISANVSGGRTPYSYIWSPGAFNTSTASGLPIGTYSVTVTDANGCIVTGTRTLAQPTVLSMTSTISNSHCNQDDGGATVTGAGGAGGYTFSLNGGAFGAGSFNALSASTYTVTIKDGNNCTVNVPLTIVDISGPTATISTSSMVSCNGGSNGSATVNATGGTAPYTYLWTPSAQTSQTASNLGTGVFGVQVKDATGCISGAAVTITQPAVLQINTLGTDPVCNGQLNGTGVASAFGGTAPYNFQWATLPVQSTANASGLGAGIHNVTVTDSKGCSKTTSITLVNPASLNANISSTNVSCSGACNGSAVVSVANGTTPYTFSWNDLNNQTTQIASGLCAGAYSVSVTDFRGCSASASISITQPSALASNIISSTNVTCNAACNGSATVNASGGTTPYAYSWSNSVSTSFNNNICAGTYTVIVTDNHSCSAQSIVTITEPTALALSATSTNATCYNVCNGTGTANFSGGTAPYTFLWQPSLSTVFNPTNLCDGTHTLTVTDNHGCIQNTTVTITEPSALTATTTVASNAVCGQSNGTAQVNVSGGTAPFSYQWSTGSTSAIITNLVGGFYVVDVTDANGCTVNSVANLNDIPAPVITIISYSDITCYGLNNGTAVVTVVGGTAPYNPQPWLLPVTLQPNPQQDGTGLYPGNNICQIIDADGCISSVTIPIFEPTQLVSATNNVIPVSCFGYCNGTATTLVTGGTTPYTYAWNDASAQPTSIASGLCHGDYTCSVTDANGCTSSQNVSISQPLPLLINNNTVSTISCYGANDGLINLTITGGNPSYNYNWSPNVGSGPILTNLAPGTDTLVVIDSKGCQQSSLYTITQPDSLSIIVNASPSTCSNANGTIGLSVSGGTPLYAYQWNDLQSQTSANAINLPAPGSYNCIVTDSRGCTKSVTTPLNDLPPPIIGSVTTTMAKCNGDSTGTATVIAQSGGSPNYTYQWFNGATQIGTTQTISNLSAGNYIVVVKDANNCNVSGTATVTEPFPLSLTVNSNQTACNGQTLGVSASAGNGTAPYTYTWSGQGSAGFGGGSYNLPYTNSSTSSSLVLPYTVTVTDTNNCPAVTQQFDITVLPKINILTTNTTGCVGNGATLTATATGGMNAPYTFTWNTAIPVTQVGAGSSIVVSVVNTTTATYTLTVSDGCSTTETGTAQVAANPTPSAAILGLNRKGCEKLAVTFIGSPGTGFNNCTYNWSFGDNTNSTDSLLVHEYSAMSTLVDSFDVQLIVTSALGCSDTAIMNNYIVVYPNPTAAFSSDPLNATEFDPNITFINQSTLGCNYSWNFGEPTSPNDTSSLKNPTHYYTGTGTYDVNLLVTTNKGCKDSIKKQVNIAKEFAIYVPNAFSPNEDTKNEMFMPVGVGIDENKYEMQIYNRWGELIFESNNLNRGWDGKSKGGKETVQEDIYVWKIIAYDLKDMAHNLSGSVMVVR